MEVHAMEHVTLFRLKVLPGKRQAVLDHFEKWDREQKSKATGFRRSILVSSNSDPDEFMGGVRWDNTENYMKNASRPEQDAWFQELRRNLVRDPEWFDGTLQKETVATFEGAPV
jgi:quinol monooxygenase YgiN